VLATGADYRRLPAGGAERFEGLGLYYAATHLEALQAAGEDVVVVGGGNSAGQAVVNLASYTRRIYLVVRRSLTATMSRYLIDRIEAADNVEIWEGCEVTALHGGDVLEAVTVTGGEQGGAALCGAELWRVVVRAHRRPGEDRGGPARPDAGARDARKLGRGPPPRAGGPGCAVDGGDRAALRRVLWAGHVDGAGRGAGRAGPPAQVPAGR
jgi:Pyridine nucleotide-disulphide oxidoreductase